MQVQLIKLSLVARALELVLPEQFNTEEHVPEVELLYDKIKTLPLDTTITGVNSTLQDFQVSYLIPENQTLLYFNLDFTEKYGDFVEPNCIVLGIYRFKV